CSGREGARPRKTEILCGCNPRHGARYVSKGLLEEGTPELEISRLRTCLQRHRRVALDTSVFIYHVEANPRYVGLTQHIFSWLERHTALAVTSTVTLMEL